MLDEKVFWININNEKLSKEDIDDNYLLNICKFISQGKGWDYFVNQNVINDIFEEAYRRKIARADILFNWHRWAEYNWLLTSENPSYYFFEDGDYVEVC